ncbi:peptidase C1 [bacterium]|nr:MAG: peptidase C1 [bacterium]
MTFAEAYGVLQIEVDLIPRGATNRNGRSLTPTYITIHNTSNPSAGADAKMHGRYQKGADARSRKVSWHFTVDDRIVVKSLPLSEQGMHAGTHLGNAQSIGIEICENKGIDQEKANDRAALLAALLLRAYGLSIDVVVPHHHWSGKNCPHLLLAQGGSGWEKFRQRVDHYHGQLDGPVGASLFDDVPQAIEARRAEAGGRTLDARPDTIDFRDKFYEATLIEVPMYRDLDEYRKVGVPILDQGQEGACTGFGLATLVHYLLLTRMHDRDEIPVSPWMLYDMARRYDEWPGEDYSGSSARGAMKGWHKHGVCGLELWSTSVGNLDDPKAKDARGRPLGAYYRVNHLDLPCMHAAITEVGVLYATARVHTGWSKVRKNGRIPFEPGSVGGHAFAIVAYDRDGFWIQNSWGKRWGNGGFGHITYDDWLQNGSDVWVARLGVPVDIRTQDGQAEARWSVVTRSEVASYAELRPHFISLGNDGLLSESGAYGTKAADVIDFFRKDLPKIMSGWKRKRLLLYAHGGLVPEDTVIQRMAEVRKVALDAEVFPMAFLWHTDLWSTLKNVLEDAINRRRPEGFLRDSVDFLLDRLDDGLEPLARQLGGKAAWDEMKENAEMASVGEAGGARLVAELVHEALESGVIEDIHLVGHSAGSIFHAPLIQKLATQGTIENGPMAGEEGFGHTIESCVLWAPAATKALFEATYKPVLDAKRIKRFRMFALTVRAELDDDCIKIYHKSLLYLVSNAFESAPRIPLYRDGVPILGMAKTIEADRYLKGLDVVYAPNAESAIDRRSNARHHGDFDDDDDTLEATLSFILGLDRKGVGREVGAVKMRPTANDAARTRAALNAIQS